MTRVFSSESEMQAGIVEHARYLGFHVHHSARVLTPTGWRTPIVGDRGFPDLVLALDGDVFAWELKLPRQRIAPEQTAWGVALGGLDGQARLEYAIVRPKTYDLALDRLDQIASGRRRR